jgi:hypothetical protein
MNTNNFQRDVPEDRARLTSVEKGTTGIDPNPVLASLKQDSVVLVRSLSAKEADKLMHDLASKLGLAQALEFQASLAGYLDQRHNVGEYFMTVSDRSDYQFIAPHSEGSSFDNMQLAAFYCFENSTDGGESILLNVDESAGLWLENCERVKRAKPGSRPLTLHEIAQVKALYQLNMPEDVRREGDQILQEYGTPIPGFTVVDVLTKPEKSYSVILNRKMNVYWDSVGSADFDSASEYERLLRKSGLLREPLGGLNLRQLDSDADRRLRHSGISYPELFKCKVTLRLAPGDFIIQNNLSWTHSAANWSPGTGTRNVVAAFA